MSRKSGFGGFGYGFGRTTPLLRKIFREQRVNEKLKPEQEKLVGQYYEKIMSMHKDGQEPSADEVKDCLRELLHASEAAEGEDPKEIDR